MMTRIDLLNLLLKFEQPLSNILPFLNDLGWDCQKPLVTLNKNHIINILERYLSQQLSSLDVEAWANAIEGREDIEYDKDSEEIIEEAIYELANPILTFPLSINLAHQWIERLAKHRISV